MLVSLTFSANGGLLKMGQILRNKDNQLNWLID